MRIRLFFALWALMPLLATSQNTVPNAGFEIWENDEPQNWRTSNLPNGRANAVTPVSPGYSGDYAVRGEVIPYPNTPGFPLIPLLISAYETNGFPVEENFSKVSLYYRYQPATNEDALGVFVGVMDAAGNSIGGGFVEVFDPTADFKILDVPVYYDNAFEPAKVVISISIYHHGMEGGLPSTGTYFEVDDVSLGDLVSSVDPPKLPEVEVNRIFPNPADQKMYIQFILSRNQQVNLELFDLSGRKVAQGFSGRLEGGDHRLPIDTSELPNGLYLCRLSTFGGAMTKKIQVFRD